MRFGLVLLHHQLLLVAGEDVAELNADFASFVGGEAEGAIRRLGSRALPDRQELLAFRQGADRDGPFFESNWHGQTREVEGTLEMITPDRPMRTVSAPVKIRNPGKNPKYPANRP